MTNNKVITDEYEILPLEWDSIHFGVSCAKVLIKKKISMDTFLKIKVNCCEYDFVTINNENNMNFNNFLIGNYSNAFLVDTQLIFAKNVENVTMYDDIEIMNNFPFNEEVMRIASNNFLFSRFYNDPYIEKEKTNDLYVKWAKSCFDKEDKYFAVCKNNGIIEGVFLFAFDEKGNADQCKGYLVVEKSCQGRGVAKKLIKSIEAFAWKKGSNLIYGGTQVDNIKMINHYISNGYKVKEKNSIYHMWTTKNG